jgi:hypothetical protein
MMRIRAMKQLHRSGRRSAAASVVVWLALSGCASLERLPPEPPSVGQSADSRIAGCPQTEPCRFLVERDTARFAEEVRTSVAKERAFLSQSGRSGPLPPVNILAVSGGGDHGAFGAGLLVGWTEAGTRPEFNMVTGISTGALIAPFAFLGPKYDGDLRAVYTTVSQKDIFKPRNKLEGLFGESLSDTTPLAHMLEKYVDQALLDAVAAEYAKGRLLLVGTSNLDTLEQVIWNMTAIAASHDPHALTLFRKVLLASASIPAAFPPVMIDVETNGVRYQEMHVDGGAEAQVFAYPPSVALAEELAAEGERPHETLYIIRNAQFDPEQANVKRSTLTIATRSVSSLIDNEGVGDLYQIYHLTQRDGVDFKLAYVPHSFDLPHPEQFDTGFMQALFKTGEDMARAGYPWETKPPGYDTPIQVTPRP